MKLRLSALALGAMMLVLRQLREQTGRPILPEGFNRSMYSFNYNVLIRMWFARWRLHGVIMFPACA